MGRESDKHSPRVDEEMKEEARSFTQGAPVESRAQESRVKEGGSDDLAEPDAVITTDGDTPPRSLSHGEAELRQELARFLDGSIFPAGRDEIIANATERHAPPTVIDRFKRLPQRRFDGFPHVWTALGGRVEGGRTH